MFAADVAVVDRLDRPAVILFDAAARLHPVEAGAGEAFLDVNRDVRIGIDAGGVVDRQRRLTGGGIERDQAPRNAQLGRARGRGIVLLRG
jgi:hypothetical protein